KRHGRPHTIHPQPGRAAPLELEADGWHTGGVRSSPLQHATRIKTPGPAAGLDIPVLGLGPEALDEFLGSDRSPPDCMQLSELDGLLTGVAIGPEPIMPSQWLPLVWGGEEPVFDDGREIQAVLGGMMSRYNQIVRDVRDGTFRPILWKTRDGELICADWAEGFGLAVSLRAKSWEPLLKAKRHALLLLPIMALGMGKDGLPALGLEPGTEQEFLRELPAILPESVMGIAQFWRERKPRPGAGLVTERITGAARVSARLGRNDPCPCGSGKKFKKCCGP
ncbi:MAG TPA: UPF0149 family protein, partial [Caulobacteraceae bacterium]